jgi:molecular chaperone GrpE
MQEKTVQPQDAQNAQNARKEGEKSAQTAEGEKSLETLLAEAQAKIEQQRDTMMRAMADAENARKRAQAEAATAQKYALERFAEGLLPVVDSLEAALKSGDTSGVELTLKQLQGALEKSGVREIDPAPGERFDPHRHQAMAAVEAQSDPNSIVAVMQKGYSLHDRVLRPALVTVAKAVEKTPENPISDTDLD